MVYQWKARGLTSYLSLKCSSPEIALNARDKGLLGKQSSLQTLNFNRKSIKCESTVNSNNSLTTSTGTSNLTWVLPVICWKSPQNVHFKWLAIHFLSLNSNIAERFDKKGWLRGEEGKGGCRQKDEKLKICPRTIVIKLQLKILHRCTSLSITWTIFLWLRLEKPRWTCFVMTVLYESLCESPTILSVHFPDPIDYFSINFCFSLPFPFILTLFKVFD